MRAIILASLAAVIVAGVAIVILGHRDSAAPIELPNEGAGSAETSSSPNEAPVGMLKPVELPVNVLPEPSTESPGEPAVSEPQSDDGDGDVTGLAQDIDYAALSTAELRELHTKVLYEFGLKATGEHIVRHKMGLAEYLGEEVAYNTGPPLVSIHHTEDGYYRTELPEFEYPEFHAAWGRISKLKDEIDLREKREREQQH